MNHSPVVIGVDGQGGSGKSTFALRLQAELGERAVIVEGDDFYRDMPDEERSKLTASEGYDQYFDWQRLEEQVLRPAHTEAETLRYQKYDWDKAAMGMWVDRPMPAILIIEGVYTLRAEFAGLLDLRIYVECSEPERLKRQADRGENEAIWIERWVAAEDFYVRNVDPKRRSDVVLDGETSELLRNS